MAGRYGDLGIREVDMVFLSLWRCIRFGWNRGNVFLDDEDRNDFISLMGEVSNRFDVDVFAYVLMDDKWSSYPAYAYGKKPPWWLKTEVTYNPALIERVRLPATSFKTLSISNSSLVLLFSEIEINAHSQTNGSQS